MRTDEELAKSQTKVYYDSVKQLKQEYDGEFIYLGVCKAPIGKIQNKFRYQVLMRLKLNKFDEIMHRLFELANMSKKSNVNCFIEINPTNLN